MSPVRTSCHTRALYTGLPVLLSHTIVVSRWFVMPTAAISWRFVSAFCSASATTERTDSQISTGSCSTQPGLGKICVNSFWPTETISPERLNRMARDDVVPWSMAMTYFFSVMGFPFTSL